MNIRKLLYLPTSEQTSIIMNDVKVIRERCKAVGDTERKEQTENQRSHNSKCPNCRASQDMIVDRIAAVEGNSSFKGNIFKITGHMSIETKPVYHCNKCGHEWQRFKIKTITDMAVTKVILDYLSDIIRNPNLSERYGWKHEAIEVFKDCCAEAIYEIQDEYKPSLRHPLRMRHLRTKYKSVFNK